MKQFEEIITVPDFLNRPAKPDKTIKVHVQDLLSAYDLLCHLGYITDVRLKRFIKLAILFHDYGKANLEFGKRLASHKKFNSETEVGHNLLSVWMVDPAIDYFSIKNATREREALAILRYTILNHHHYVNNLEELRKPETKRLAEKNLTGLPYFPLSVRDTNAIRDVKDNKYAIMATGILCKCDHAASGGMIIEYENDCLERGLEKLLEEWQNENRKASWNELQQFCRDHRQDNLVVTAPTGLGKTEAGLHWFGNTKCFYVLPLRTAISAMFERIRTQIIRGAAVENRLGLLDSDMFSVYEQLSEVKIGGNEELNILEYGRQTKQLSLPINISTPDQLFGFVFKNAGYEMQLSTLVYSKIIIDEIQAYDAELLAYIAYGIRRIYELGGKFCILTATLPPFIEDRLIHQPGCDLEVVRKDFSAQNNDVVRHYLHADDGQLTAGKVIAAYKRHCARGEKKKILVVCNTIKKAQEIYGELEAQNVANIHLLHSKFIKKDRRVKEKAILDDGRTTTVKSVIWISTSLVEASLDIDFDELHTELSDLCGLFQRMGRCNRKGQKNVSEANCFVYLTIEPKLLNKAANGYGFIDKTIHELSKEAIKNWEGIISDPDKQRLINQYLTKERVADDCPFIRKYKAGYQFVKDIEPEEYDKILMNFRNILAYTVIPKVVYDQNRQEIDEILAALQKIESTFEKNRLLSKDDSKRLNKIEIASVIRQRIKLENEFLQFTVGVGLYDVFYVGKKDKNKSAIIDIKKIRKKDNVFIIEGSYNEKMGYSRLSKRERQAKIPNYVWADCDTDAFI